MANIRHQVNIAVTPRVVWRALTTEEGVTSWWAPKARIDAREGGRVVLTTPNGEGAEIEERGMFHELRPTRKIEIAWDTTSPAPTKGTRIEFQIAKDGDETRLILVHSGGGILSDEEGRAALEARWKAAMTSLRDALEREKARA